MEKSFLQIEGECRDGVIDEKGHQQESSTENIIIHPSLHLSLLLFVVNGCSVTYVHTRIDTKVAIYTIIHTVGYCQRTM